MYVRLLLLLKVKILHSPQPPHTVGQKLIFNSI